MVNRKIDLTTHLHHSRGALHGHGLQPPLPVNTAMQVINMAMTTKVMATSLRSRAALKTIRPWLETFQSSDDMPLSS